jgi:hypothetical protein
MTHAGGRPSKYTDEMPALLLGAMKAGKSVVRFCADVGIAKSTFSLWCEKHVEFSIAFEEAKIQCESYWEYWLVNNLANKEVNSALVKLFFANRFGWHDKTESRHDVTVRQEDAIKDLG